VNLIVELKHHAAVLGRIEMRRVLVMGHGNPRCGE
jgi:hypothetical protein